jgi:hypothetical protein
VWWATIAVAVALIVLWALLTYVAHRPLSRLARLHCPSCGAAFGIFAARAGKQRYGQQCQAEWERIEARLGHSALVDFDGIWPVECPSCCSQSSYDSTEERLCDPA